MKIYKQEVLDGLDKAIANNSVACITNVLKCEEISDALNDEKVAQAFASVNKDQIDLFYLNAVLVSAGWNKNDDVFDRLELWNARTTPVDKPFNLMHDDEDIIGHITDSITLDHQGNVLNEFVDNEFDIVISAVLYKIRSDLERKQQIADIIQDINEDKWKVSMECIFKDFDYALIDTKGQHRIIERNESSAFLTKHLRSYGGTGYYEDYKIGRLLKNMFFSGVGLVSTPANPRSIILKTDPFNGSQAKIEEIIMPDVTVANDTTVAEQLENANKTIAEKDTRISELEKALSECMDENKKLKEENMKNKKAMVYTKRKASLVGVLDDSKIEETLTKFEDSSDDVFDTMVSLVKSNKKEVAKEKLEDVEIVAEKTEATLVIEDETDNVAEKQETILAVASWLRGNKNKKVKE